MNEEKRAKDRQYLRSWRAAKRVFKNIEKKNTEVNDPEQVPGCQTDSDDALSSMHLSTGASSTWEESDWDDDFVEDMDLDENYMTDLEDMTDHNDKSSLGTDLATWASQFQVKHNAVDHLLKVLQQHGHTDLPSTARTLLKTPRHLATIQKSGMEYFHYPLHQKLLEHLEKYPVEELQNHDTIDLSFNVDGLPLFKSSGRVMWPVLCAIHLNPIVVFPTTLTCGNNRPKDLHFFEDFVADLEDLLSNGIQCKGKKHSINVLCIVCDAPAKAFVRGTKLYSGYYGCDKCDQKGEWFNRVTFQDTENLTLRTDASFRSQVQPEHHKDSTPLAQLSIDMVKSFPIDYMHQSCLGVTKKLLLSWTSGARGVRLSSTQKLEVSTRLLQLKNEMPSIFSRTPRSLGELDRWKATEFRQFMLYTGKLVLKGILEDDLYQHFLAFSVAMCLLVSPTLVKRHSEYAGNLLHYFVCRGRELYGEEFIVYNIHSMLHITEDAVQFNGLDNCSAFKFESYLHTMKRMVRSGKHPLRQVAKRIEERQPSPLEKHRERKTVRAKDKAFLLHENGCEITDEMEKDGKVLCRVYHNPLPMFIEPCHSFLVGVYNYNKKQTSMRWIPREQLEKRAIRINQGDTVTFMAILHLQ